MSATAIQESSTKSGVPLAVAGMLLAVGPWGLEVGTGGAATFEYLKVRGNRGYPFALYDSASRVADAIAARTPVENLEHIRSVLNPTVTDIAELLRVSRQAIYDWQAGKPITSENALRLADLAEAADVFAVEGLRGTSEALRRPIRDGKSFFSLVGEDGSAESAARMLVDIVRTETRQRQALEKRLAGRKRLPREAFEDVGTPMLDERG
jgi:transcriptional regulator with XRE-family HTH domain